MSFREITYLLFYKSKNGFFTYAEENYNSHLQLLEETNILAPLKNAYLVNIKPAVEELYRFTAQFDLEDTHIATKATFFLNHVLLMLKKLPATINELSNYNEIGLKFFLPHLINIICDHRITLANMLKSIENDLGLIQTHQFFIHVEGRLKHSLRQISITFLYAVDRYEDCMIKFNLDRIKPISLLNL